MIKDITLQNFLTFEDKTFKFSPTINIICGDRNTGKTHLIKTAYTLQRFHKISEYKNYAKLNNSLLEIFSVYRISELKNKNIKGKQSSISATFNNNYNASYTFCSEDKKIEGVFSNNSKYLNLITNSTDETNYSIYIPEKEMLTTYEGFISLYKGRYLSFDSTYYDICVELGSPFIKMNLIPKKIKELLTEIETFCNGKFIRNFDKFEFKSGKNIYDINLVSSTLCKLGQYHVLLNTGAVWESQYNNTIYIDDSNLDLDTDVLDLLSKIFLELSFTYKQQIILTTKNVSLWQKTLNSHMISMIDTPYTLADVHSIKYIKL